MRPRKWVLAVAFCFLTLALIFYYVKHSLERNGNLENLLIEAVSSSINGSCSVEAVRIGFFSVYLQNVSVSLPLRSIAVTVRDIKVGFSLPGFVLSRGNPAASINQIIFIRPRIDFSLTGVGRGADSATAAVPFFRSPARMMSSAPVEKLLVKAGIIRLCDGKNDTIVLSEDLSGRLWNSPDEISVSLNGRAGSTGKNISLQGGLSLTRDRHHISLRLNKARLTKGVAIKDLSLLSGTINGVVECTFTSDFHPDSLELHGQVELSGASAAVAGNPPNRLDSMALKLFLENNTVNVSALEAVYRGIRISAIGKWLLSGKGASSFKIECRRLIADSLYGILPDSVLKRMSGKGTVQANILLSKGADPSFLITISGFEAFNIPIEKALAAGRFSGTKIYADSVFFKTSLLKAQCKGEVDLNRAKKEYDIGFSVTMDSLPDRYGVKGYILVLGNAISKGGLLPYVNLRLSAKSLSYRRITLGNHQLVGTLENGRLTFQSLPTDETTSVTVSGVLDQLFSSTPVATFSAAVGARPIKELLERINGMPEIDSAHLILKATGRLDSFSVAADMKIATALFGGCVMGRMEHSPSLGDALIWKLLSKDVRYKNIPLSFTASGRLLDSMIVVDSMSDHDGIRGRARIFHTTSPPRVDAVIEFCKPVAGLLGFLFEGRTGLESGTVDGKTVVTGTFDSLSTRSNVRLRNVGSEELGGFSTDLTCFTYGKQFVVLPATIRRDAFTVLNFDTISNRGGRIRFKGSFSNLTPRMLLGPLIPAETDIDAFVNGTLASTGDRPAVEFICAAPYLTFETMRLDSLRCGGRIDRSGITVSRFDFSSADRVIGHAEGFIPWAMIGGNFTESDTLRASVHLEGDLLAAVERNIPSPIGGTAMGSADIAIFAAAGNLRFTRGEISIPQGILRVKPFVLDDIKNFTFLMTIDSNAAVHASTSGAIRRRPISIVSEHRIPQGYEPLLVGPLNFGVIQVITPKKGVDLHLPGFMPPRDRGSIEFRGKEPFDYFTISGPLDRLKLTGTWVLRDVEFTYPFLPKGDDNPSWGFDPFPYINWEMDVVTGNRNVMYFWDLTGRKNRIMRFLEAYLHPSSILKVRGRYTDNTFRLYGTIRSNKGAVYYGRVFDRNFDIGVEFVPQRANESGQYDNFPIVWGSAEAFADTSRLNRIKLTCMVTDPVTGAISEKGRLVDGPRPNMTFHLSSDFDELPGESEREFYRRAGITISTIKGAGGVVSELGEQMFHRYLLQRWERRLARKLGLDVMNIETSIVSNYFNKLYSRQFDGLLNEEDYLTLANVGVTVGRYFFRDFLLVKARGELVPIDMTLTPEYSIGLEFQPGRFFLMDVNYGFHMKESKVEYNPLLMLQLRLPIARLRNLLNF